MDNFYHTQKITESVIELYVRTNTIEILGEKIEVNLNDIELDDFLDMMQKL